jgi:hypothetical protein
MSSTNFMRDGVTSDVNRSEIQLPVPLSHGKTASPACLYFVGKKELKHVAKHSKRLVGTKTTQVNKQISRG